MKAIKSLIKLSKKKLDLSIWNKKVLDLEAEQVAHEIALLNSQIQKEAEVFYGTEYTRNLEYFIRHANTKKSALLSKLKQVQKEGAKIQEEIRGYFEELKRFEIVDANIQKKKFEAEKKDTIKSTNEMVRLKSHNVM